MMLKASVDRKSLGIVMTIVLGTLTGLLQAGPATAKSKPVPGVVAWGVNEAGQLGDGTTTGPQTCSTLPCNTVPANIVNDSPFFSEIAAGGSHSLALIRGAVMAWGDNSHGQLGTTGPTESDVPVAVLGVGGTGTLSGVKAVSAGAYHSLALLNNGTVVAWGDNGAGELGNNTTTQSNIPVPVLGIGGNGLLGGVKAIAAGGYFSLALLNDGTVVAWGVNNWGQLGNNSMTESNVPVLVSGLRRVKAIAAGFAHGLALLSKPSQIMAWGRNDHGELGHGTTSGPQMCSGIACSTTPVFVDEETNVKAIAAGGGSDGDHSLALLDSGGVVGWGLNGFGELGNGTTTTTGCACSDTPTTVIGISRVKAIAAGGEHSLAILKGGTVVAWGYNVHGQLGDDIAAVGGCGCSDSPVVTLGVDGVGSLSKAFRISAGGEHSLAWVK
jgi:alpha-tubulin suppressor-like RCC1 family protein